MICRFFAAGFFPILIFGTFYQIITFQKKDLPRNNAASEPTMYFIDVLYKTNQT